MPFKKHSYLLLSQLKLSKDKYKRWPKIASTLKLSKKACQRLNWMIYYETAGEKNAKKTCRHFDISRSLWYYWRSRFNEENLRTLEDEFKAPRNTRKKEYTALQYERIIMLRKKHIRYGKMKLLKIYVREYPDDKNISSWKVQCIIEASGVSITMPKECCRPIERR